MNEIWIKEKGSVQEAALTSLIKKYCGDSQKYCCAFYTDHFQSTGLSGQDDERISKLMADTGRLLELRIFDLESELYLFRTTTGHDFTYRIADDSTLKSNLAVQATPFLQKYESHRMEQVQLIDMDSGYKPGAEGQFDPYGARQLRTTGGGTYSLSLNGNEDAMIVISYISYDENGSATISDIRWAGYADEKEWRKNHESC